MGVPSASVIFSHWYTLIENLQCSSMAFYQSVENDIGTRHVPQANMSRVTWPEGGVFSARREYLRVKRRDLILDICAAPFWYWIFYFHGVVRAKARDLGVFLRNTGGRRYFGVSNSAFYIL